ncbi:hypothetical protein NC99_32120 [Sunxiuqinia dokdonensis]|uniref:Uncharacterized protein n=1 Tax=Sunxiuqinia dokdonensis TaxID=1409788 RepID=A0A0L8V6D0_9BACT|nr:hypothetical protein NC99_32120 [Sunxiuqinia dokdonensis]
MRAAIAISSIVVFRNPYLAKVSRATSMMLSLIFSLMVLLFDYFGSKVQKMISIE